MITRSLAAASLAASILWTGAARADGPYEGQWREGPTTIQVSITSWGTDCGPRPQSTTSPGGGTFRITQAGDHLTFHLRQERTTRGCWSENRAVRRVSSSHQAGTWRIVCRTPADDSRGETGRYTIQAVGTDRLSFTDVSEYDWRLNESSCQARMQATQSFTRVGGAAEPTASPTPATPRPRCTPGAPARILLRPARAEVQPGGEQCFSAAVVDAAGCPVRGRPTLRLASGSAGSVRGLCYSAPDDAATARVVASSGALTAEAQITVRTMDLSDLIARRSENQTLPGDDPGDASSDTAARVSARGAEEGPELLWPAIAVAAALGLLLLGALVLRSRARPRVDLPVRKSERPPADVSVPSTPPLPTEDMICPKCRTGYPPGAERCAKDDTALVTYREFSAGAGQNVCPTCGERYPRSVKFCGKDGATLEPSA